MSFFLTKAFIFFRDCHLHVQVSAFLIYCLIIFFVTIMSFMSGNMSVNDIMVIRVACRLVSTQTLRSAMNIRMFYSSHFWCNAYFFFSRIFLYYILGRWFFLWNILGLSIFAVILFWLGYFDLELTNRILKSLPSWYISWSFLHYIHEFHALECDCEG